MLLFLFNFFAILTNEASKIDVKPYDTQELTIAPGLSTRSAIFIFHSEMDGWKGKFGANVEFLGDTGIRAVNSTIIGTITIENLKPEKRSFEYDILYYSLLNGCDAIDIVFNPPNNYRFAVGDVSNSNTTLKPNMKLCFYTMRRTYETVKDPKYTVIFMKRNLNRFNNFTIDSTSVIDDNYQYDTYYHYTYGFTNITFQVGSDDLTGFGQFQYTTQNEITDSYRLRKDEILCHPFQCFGDEWTTMQEYLEDNSQPSESTTSESATTIISSKETTTSTSHSSSSSIETTTHSFTSSPSTEEVIPTSETSSSSSSKDDGANVEVGGDDYKIKVSLSSGAIVAIVIAIVVVVIIIAIVVCYFIKKGNYGSFKFEGKGINMQDFLQNFNKGQRNDTQPDKIIEKDLIESSSVPTP